MDDGIIDLAEYQRRKLAEAEPARTTFALWGGEGERTRFALPLWRAAYMVGGGRSAVAWEREKADGRIEPYVVLDLLVDPARTELPADLVRNVRDVEAPPALTVEASGVAAYLGERNGRRWYLLVEEPETVAEASPAELRSIREDLSFLAGECSGLLFHRDLDAHAAD